MTCAETQEKITRGDPLDAVERDHALGCSECGGVVALAATLDALDPGVPAGFAERVMARIAVETNSGALEPLSPPRWYEGRRAGVLLAAAATLVFVLNAARFVAGVLIPAGSFGGAP